MREWSTDAQIAMLKWLTDVVQGQPLPINEIELWRVRKGERPLRCLTAYRPSGIDLRLFEASDFRRMQHVRDSLAVTKLSDKWRAPLLERGWTRSPWLTDGLRRCAEAHADPTSQLTHPLYPSERTVAVQTAALSFYQRIRAALTRSV